MPKDLLSDVFQRLWWCGSGIHPDVFVLHIFVLFYTQPCGIWHCSPWPKGALQSPPRGRCRRTNCRRAGPENCGAPNHPNPKLLSRFGMPQCSELSHCLRNLCWTLICHFFVNVITSVQVSLQCPAWRLSPVNLKKKHFSGWQQPEVVAFNWNQFNRHARPIPVRVMMTLQRYSWL